MLCGMLSSFVQILVLEHTQPTELSICGTR